MSLGETPSGEKVVGLRCEHGRKRVPESAVAKWLARGWVIEEATAPAKPKPRRKARKPKE